jgi:hypothetical protein
LITRMMRDPPGAAMRRGDIYCRLCIVARLLLWSDSTSCCGVRDGKKDGVTAEDHLWLHDMATEHTPLTAEISSSLDSISPHL